MWQHRIVFWVKDVVRHVEPNIVFNRNGVLVGPVDMVGVGLWWSRPIQCESTCIEF
jgi:hypothetical protein